MEAPLTVQLGGADEHALADAAKVSKELGFNEINLNCGTLIAHTVDEHQ